MERVFPLEIFRKILNTFRGTFSRFYGNDRKIGVRFTFSHNSHAVVSVYNEMEQSFPLENFQMLSNGTHSSRLTLFVENLYCSVWRKIPSCFSTQMEKRSTALHVPPCCSATFPLVSPFLTWLTDILMFPSHLNVFQYIFKKKLLNLSHVT